jgi:hypothetical protein
MRKINLVAGLSMSLSFALGCASEQPVEPPTLGKGDAFGSVADRGNLAFDEAAVAEITRDLQFDGYRLYLGQPGTVTLETTHLGSSAGFDTTLFIYGPKTVAGGYGDSYLAIDDDGGWGRLSKLSSLDLEFGEYLVVVGTPDALGRGRYRLQATCESGDCGAAPNGLTVAEQNQLLDELNDDCVFQACDGDFGWYAPSVTCNFPAQQCTVDFVVLASLGDRVTVAHFDDLVGRTASMSFLGGKSFTAYFDRAGGMIGEVTLEYRCVLARYQSSLDVLDGGQIAENFRWPLKACVLEINRMTHDMI